MQDKLDRARKASEKLRTVSDALNEKLAQVEGALVALRLGVSASVPLGQGCHLEFAKRNGTFGLLFLVPHDTRIPLRSASRQYRLLAADALPALLDRLIETAETELAAVSEAASRVQAFCASLPPPPEK